MTEDTELQAIAVQQDDAIGNGLAELVPVPERPYKAKVVSGLASALGAVLALMDVPLELDAATEDVPELAPELVRTLAMVAAAAADYGQPLPIPLEEVRGDNELIVITDHLSRLAKDRDFKDFIEEQVEEEPELELEAETATVEADTDALLMSRM